MERQGPGPSRALAEPCLWILVWLAARVALLAALCDVFGYGEEFEKACAGKALLDGVPIPLSQLPYHPYEGGGFVVSVLDALAFAVLGQSVLAVKSVALLLGVLVLAAGWALCERFAGRVAARTFALLYVFAPESVQTNSLLALGIHYQACLFIALILLLALRIAVARDDRPMIWTAFGLSAGFGVYFSYQCVLTTVVAAGLIAAARRRDALRSGTALALFGALLGALPLFWMRSEVGSAVFDIHGTSLASTEPKLEVLSAFARSLFEGRPWWDWPGTVGVAVLAVAAFLALRRVESRALRWTAYAVLGHALLFLAAYLGTGFTVGAVYVNFVLHRLTPLWFLAIVWIGLASAHSPWLRRTGLAVALCGALDTGRMVRDAAPGTPLLNLQRLDETKGYRYSQYLQKIAPRMSGERTQKLALLLHFDESPPEHLHTALAIALYGSGEGSFESMCDEIRAAGIENLAGFQRGLGLMLMRHHGREFAQRVAAVEPFPDEIETPLLEGIGAFGQSWEFGTEDAVLGEAALAVQSALPDALVVGLGRRLNAAVGDARIRRSFERRKGPVGLDVARLDALLEQAPESTRAALRRGFEAEAAERALGP